MGLVTGIVDKHSVVEWADREITRNPVPTHALIELSLSSQRPYSEIIELLSDFEGEPGYDPALKLLLARAGLLLEQDPGQAVRIIMGLRLLVEEQFLPQDEKALLIELTNCLNMHEQNKISYQELADRLAHFLEMYVDYRPRLSQVT
jgi:hypothetical protein